MTILLTDVDYPSGGGARAAGVVIEHWDATDSVEERTVWIDEVDPYEPGAFYRRELPCLLALLERVDSTPTCVVVDGHVWLDGRPGLGARLHEATGLPVVGVAKNAFAGGEARELLRGESRRPLYVSSVGMPVDEACRAVASMAGEHRLPSMLKRVDRLARDGA